VAEVYVPPFAFLSLSLTTPFPAALVPDGIRAFSPASIAGSTSQPAGAHWGRYPHRDGEHQQELALSSG
jgi:hypothetical protein